MQIDIVDVTYSEGDDGETRLNLGDTATGVGFAASAPSWGSGDGFIGVPNGPSADGSSASALMLTQGNERMALAIRDTRWDAQAGALAPGDRAVVSNCDAALLLDQSSNTIELRATTANAVKVDGDANTVTITRGSNTVVLGTSSLQATVGAGSVTVTNTSITFQVGPLVLTMSGNTVSIATQSGPPAVLMVNLVPMTVP